MANFNQLTILFCLLIGISVISIGSSAPTANEIPEKFLGSWDLDHSENFDEYLEVKGYGWFMRQVVKMASISKVFRKTENNLYLMKVLTSKTNVEWNNVKLGQEFEGPYVDDTQHKILFTYDPVADQLIEKHTKLDAPNTPDVYKYEIDPQGFLLMHMEWKGVSTKRYYKKSDKDL